MLSSLNALSCCPQAVAVKMHPAVVPKVGPITIRPGGSLYIALRAGEPAAERRRVEHPLQAGCSYVAAMVLAVVRGGRRTWHALRT